MKRLILLAAVLCLPVALSAQNFFRPGPGFDPGSAGRLRFGVTGGLNISTISKPAEQSRKSVGGGLEILHHFQVSVQWFQNLGHLFNEDKIANVPGAVSSSYNDIKNYQGIKLSLAVLF